MPRHVRLVAALVLAALLTPARPALAAPANDDFAGAVPVALGGSASTDITAATFGPGEPAPSCWEFPAESHAVWFRFDAAATGGVVADTAGSSFASPDDDTVLAVFRGADLASLVEVACNDDFGPDYQAQVGFVATAGETYHLLAGGWDASEVGTLALSLEGAPLLSGVTTLAADGSPAPGVAADLFDAAGYLLRSAATDGSGAYSLVARPGDYRVRFGGDGGYAMIWYDGASGFAGATPLALGPGGLAGIGASLVASSIGGAVRDALSAAPLAGITVSVVDGGGVVVGAATTDVAGRYVVGHLAAGDYRVGFSDPAGGYLPRWHPGAPSLAGATPVTVGSGPPPVVDIELQLGSGFAGTVTSAAGGPIAGALVIAVDAAGAYPPFITDPTGAYSATGLPPGTYAVQFSDPTRAHATEWYDDQPDQAVAGPVTVAAGSVAAGIDAVLAVDPAGPRGTIAGVVTDAATGAPLAGVEVRVGAMAATTAADGSYVLDGVPPGAHVVDFSDPAGAYQGASVPATVAAGQTSTVDAALQPLAAVGVLAGTVTDASSGAPLAGIEVVVGTLVTTTAADGSYALAGVPAGDHVVEFRDPAGGYHGETVAATVAAGGTTTVDAALTPVGANRPPVAVPDAAVVEQGKKLDGPSVLGNDSDPDGDPLVADLVTGPAHGTLQFAADGTYAYKHGGGAEAADEFTYRAGDGELWSEVTTVSLTIAPKVGEAGGGSGGTGDPGSDPEASVLGALLGRGGDLGLVDPGQGRWHLRSREGVERAFYFGNPGDYPMMGDWDCDGVDTPGLYRRSDGYVYLRNSNTVGIADIRFFFGDPGDLPLAGDFDGDGCDTVSIYRPAEARTYVINDLGADEGGLGAADFSFLFGNPGDKPFVGDFDADGVETVGLHRESTGLVYFRNTNTTGIADNEFIYGDPGDRLVASDWTADGADSPAVFRPSDTTFYLRHHNTPGYADETLVMGEESWLPIAGWFDL